MKPSNIQNRDQKPKRRVQVALTVKSGVRAGYATVDAPSTDYGYEPIYTDDGY
jgi:hypothetical protein